MIVDTLDETEKACIIVVALQVKLVDLSADSSNWFAVDVAYPALPFEVFENGLFGRERFFAFQQ